MVSISLNSSLDSRSISSPQVQVDEINYNQISNLVKKISNPFRFQNTFNNSYEGSIGKALKIGEYALFTFTTFTIIGLCLWGSYKLYQVHSQNQLRKQFQNLINPLLSDTNESLSPFNIEETSEIFNLTNKILKKFPKKESDYIKNNIHDFLLTKTKIQIKIQYNFFEENDLINDLKNIHNFNDLDNNQGTQTQEIKMEDKGLQTQEIKIVDEEFKNQIKNQISLKKERSIKKINELKNDMNDNLNLMKSGVSNFFNDLTKKRGNEYLEI